MYGPLYIKTNNSLLSSMIRLEDLIDYALKNHIKALTITDNNMFGVMDFYHLCINNSIKPIIGLEVTLDDSKIICYAKNYAGYQNLCQICTKMSDKTLTIEDFIKLSDNLFKIVPYEYFKLYDKLKSLKDIFVSYSNNEQLEKLKIPNLLYMKETLYLNKNDKEYFPYLLAIKEGKTLNEIAVSNNDYTILSIEEIKNNYPSHLDNNKYIIENCTLEFLKPVNLLPVYKCSDNLDSYSYLKKLCKNGLKKKFGNEVREAYLTRLKYELEVINKMEFCNYFLVVWDYVKYSKEHNILVGPGRGSAAGSLVAYLLDITDIDPLKYNLMFERFLNPERVTMPDIDIDFAFDKRDQVIDYCINKYGSKKVVPIITFGTLKAKQAIRDVARVMNIDIKDVDFLTKMIDPFKDLETNLKDPKIVEYLNYNKALAKCYKIALKFENFKRHTSIHAAGIVMSDINLDNVIPLFKHDNFYVTGFDMTYLESLGLLKMDFLGLKNLTLIDNIISDINTDLTFDNIEMDNKVLSIFNKGNTLGIFQFESAGMINFLKKFEPTTFEDVIASIALFRPGPMFNIDSYIRRKKGLETIDYLDKSLTNILKPTYGIIVYQEQIIKIASVMAGYSLGEADILRRAMSKKKKEILLNEKDKFINQSIKLGYSKEIASKVYEHILKFASYGFNRAHSVAYAVIAYKMAYLKYYYPTIFLKNILSNALNSTSDTKKYIYEAKANGIKIKGPDINKSMDNYIIDSDNIIFPLNGIKNVGISTVKSIIEERNKGLFKDIFDFVKRVKISKNVFENLIFSGCFDSFNINKRTLINNLDEIINYSEIGELLDDSLKPILNDFSEFDEKEILKHELEIFGFYLNNHPVTKFKAQYKTINLNNIESYFDKMIDLIGMVDKVKKISTKKGEDMSFWSLSDELFTVDAILFPKTYQLYDTIKIGDIVLVNAKVEKRFDKYQLIVNKVKVLKG